MNGDGGGEATGDAGALLKRARRFGQDSKSMIIPKDLWDKVRLRLWLFVRLWLWPAAVAEAVAVAVAKESD